MCDCPSEISNNGFAPYNSSVVFKPFPAEMYNTDTVPAVAVFRNGGYMDYKTGRIQTCTHMFRLNQCGFISNRRPLKNAIFPVNEHNAAAMDGSECHVRRFDRFVFLAAKYASIFYHDTVEHMPRLNSHSRLSQST
jgi:hypothetical protein